MQNVVRIRELTGWGFDCYEYRPPVVDRARCPRVQAILAQRSLEQQAEVVLAAETERLRELFTEQAERPDLLAEMCGLQWSMGVVDLRPLLAFQRRLALRVEEGQPLVPHAADWPALLQLCFGPAKPVEYETTRDCAGRTVVLQSGNPNLHFRFSNDPTTPLRVHAGGPFFEATCFRGRWFLRDGYHRAYALLKGGVFAAPAVIVHADSLEELGANQPWFFPERVLFSQAPPRVVDFLNQDLVLEYERPALVKTLRITLEEGLSPNLFAGER